MRQILRRYIYARKSLKGFPAIQQQTADDGFPAAHNGGGRPAGNSSAAGQAAFSRAVAARALTQCQG